MWTRLFALLIFLPGAGLAQFRPAAPGYEFAFPRDHGSHDDYQTEWWYYTGHLRTDDGHRYGFEVTFFRVGIADPAVPASGGPWELRHLSLAHFAITDIDGKAFRYYEKLNRSSPFTARQATGFLEVTNEGWSATTLPDGGWRVQAFAGKDRLDLVLHSRKPPAIHGENGVSVKAAGAGYASHYYSMTRLEAAGTIDGRRCQGVAWMDHEFGSSRLRENQSGWDWFSVQLENETELMIYIIRKSDGTPDVTSSGSIVTGDGTVIHLRHDQFRVTSGRKWKSPRSGATYPMGWRITAPAFEVDLRLEPVLEQQELITRASTRIIYWEGAVTVSGSLGNMAASGKGYVEMTGYDRAFRAP